MKTLDEPQVGILCFISHHPGFRAILKQRYSDFIVNEVDRDGIVVHLTSFDLPLDKVEVKETKSYDSSPTKNYSEEIECFRSLAGDANADSLKVLLDRIASARETDVPPIVLSPDPDKLHRTEVHNFFKAKFKFLVTDTVDGMDASSKCVRVRFGSEGNSGRGRSSRKRKDRGDVGDSVCSRPFDSRGSKDWPESVGKFLRFHLYKENKDTQEALGVIGKMLGVQQRSFGFAGTKDKRSISTQRVTVFKQHAERLAALNDRLFGIKVGDFCYVKEGLFLGQLLGNRFTITLRGVVVDSEDTIKAAAKNLGANGFINYFGLQRFGSGAVPTHLIGAALLRGEWKNAVGLILDPREGEHETVMEVREFYKESGDIDVTLRKLPRHLIAERAILQCLKKCPGNYLQALKAIPRTLRMMYVHSYQSYLWNHAASMRVLKYGTDQIVVGDLVFSKVSSHEKEAENMENDAECDNPSNEIDYTNDAEISEATILKENIQSVKVVSAEDLLKGEYTIDDVILPLPGSRVIYPTNNVAQVYHDFAKKDGISLIESVHNAKEFSMTSMTGAYRRVFQRPLDFEWEVLRYTDSNKPLAETDIDVMAMSKPVTGVKDALTDENESRDLPKDSERKSEICEEGNGFPDANEAGDGQVGRLPTDPGPKTEICEKEDNGLPDANKAEGGQGGRPPEAESVSMPDVQLPHLALKLSFTLPASCYATMAIRELLKTSTSVAFHKALNE